MGEIRWRLTAIHLWIGEHLGLTRYVSCWSCKHSRVIEESPEVCGCVATEDDRLCTFGYGAVSCCEAVWCPYYVEKEWDQWEK